VRLVQPRPGDLAARNREFVSEHHDLELLVLARAKTQRRERKRTPKQQIHQRHDHGAVPLRSRPKEPDSTAAQPRPAHRVGRQAELRSSRHPYWRPTERQSALRALYRGGEDHVGRRRAVQVARRVEASAGWCVYSSPTAVTAKPTSWREARTSASVWKYCR